MTRPVYGLRPVQRTFLDRIAGTNEVTSVIMLAMDKIIVTMRVLLEHAAIALY